MDQEHQSLPITRAVDIESFSLAADTPIADYVRSNHSTTVGLSTFAKLRTVLCLGISFQG